MLTSYLRGRCSHIIKAFAKRRDGFDIWFQLMKEFEPTSRQQSLALEALASYPLFSKDKFCLALGQLLPRWGVRICSAHLPLFHVQPWWCMTLPRRDGWLKRPPSNGEKARVLSFHDVYQFTNYCQRACRVCKKFRACARKELAAGRTGVIR